MRNELDDGLNIRLGFFECSTNAAIDQSNGKGCGELHVDNVEEMLIQEVIERVEVGTCQTAKMGGVDKELLTDKNNTICTSVKKRANPIYLQQSDRWKSLSW